MCTCMYAYNVYDESCFIYGLFTIKERKKKYPLHGEEEKVTRFVERNECPKPISSLLIPIS